MNKYSKAIIRLKNLKHNIKEIKKLIGNDKKILIPVKCNAYGFGIKEISYYLQKNKLADYLGVAYPFEAIELRQAGIKLPILVFGKILFKEDYKNIIKYNFTPTVLDFSDAEKINFIGNKNNKKINVHINVDTGMGRIGLHFRDAENIIRKINTLSNINIEGIYSHLSAADERNKTFTENQIKLFTHIIDNLRYDAIIPKFVHILNSAGIINYSKVNFNMVRPGIMFYGYFPDNNIKKNIKLKQGLSLYSYVTFIKNVEKETPISYGHTYLTKRREKIATIAIGYGDGLNRLLSNKGIIYIGEKKCYIRGRVCMDQIMVNVDNIKNLNIGTKVLIFGKDRTVELKLESLAEQLGTIPYEILCRLGDRVEKVYID